MEVHPVVPPPPALPYFHRLGRSACGLLAFKVDRSARPHGVMRASDVLLPNGRHAEPCSRVVCGSCGRAPEWPIEAPSALVGRGLGHGEV